MFGLFEVTVNTVVDKLVTSEESSRVNSRYKRVKMWGRFTIGKSSSEQEDDRPYHKLKVFFLMNIQCFSSKESILFFNNWKHLAVTKLSTYFAPLHLCRLQL